MSSGSTLHRKVVRFAENPFIEWPHAVFGNSNHNFDPVAPTGQIVKVQLDRECHASLKLEIAV